MSSSNQTPNYTHKPLPGAPFAYQTRLLERTSSSGGSSRSPRNNSQPGPGVGILATPTGSSNTSLGSRRRAAPSHRPSSSLDVLRGKWEERVREVETEEHPPGNYNPIHNTVKSRSQPTAPENITLDSTSNPVSLHSGPSSIPSETPLYLKRRTIADPIIASPFSPNITGTSAEADTPSLTSPHQIRTPSSTAFTSPKYSILHPSTSQNIFPPSSTRFVYEMPRTSRTRQSSPLRNHTSQPSHSPSTNSSDNSPDIRPVVAQQSHHIFSPSPATSAMDTPRNRSRSLYGSSTTLSTPEKSAQQPFYTLSRNKSVTSLTHDQRSTKLSSMTPLSELEAKRSTPSQLSSPSPMGCPSPSVISSTPYRSSYMSSKRASAYEDPISSRRDYSPRIKSGDGDENWEERKAPSIQDRKLVQEDVNGVSTRKGWFEQDLYAKTTSISHSTSVPDIPGFAISESDGVAGLPGRLQLKAPSGPAVPDLSAWYYGSNWADTQRHLIQAYEYLCHVGEAHQWIEGCLGEEIGFNIVEMEEGLRNGVVLAKLVRVFHPQAVRRIFEV